MEPISPDAWHSIRANDDSTALRRANNNPEISQIVEANVNSDP